VNYIYLFFFAAAWIVIQCLIGGTRLLFSLPAYGLLAIGAVLSIASVRARRNPPHPTCVAATLLLGGWVLYRSFHSPVEYLALPDFFMMIACLTAYLMTAYYFTGMRDRTILIGVLWAIAALEVWCGLIQFLKDPHFMLFGLLRSQNIERASGLFISPNHFAGFLEAVAIISLSLVIWSRWPVWAKILGSYIAFSCWIGVAISGSRGGYFSTIITLVVFSIGSIWAVRAVNRERFMVALISFLGAVVIMVAAAAFLMTHSQYLTHRMQTMVVKDVRIYNWEAALDHIKVSPWIGTGAGTHLIYGRLFRRQPIQADPVHAHCDYLELIAEYGVVGGVCMLLFLIAHVRSGLKAYSEILHRRLVASGIARSNSFALNLGVLSAVAGLAAHSVVDFNMHIPGNALVFAFIFGVLANPNFEHPPNFVERRVLPFGRLLIPALGAWMIWAGLPLLPSEWCSEQARIALRDGKYLLAVDYAKLGVGSPTVHPFDPPVGDFNIGGQPWISYLGGLDGLIKRFGPNPKNPDMYFYMGEANRALALRMNLYILKQHFYQEAIPAFEAGLKVFPQDENALARLAQCFDGMRDYQAAEEVYQQCFKVDPNLGIMYGYYASHLMAEGRTMEAAAALKKEHDLDYGEVDADKRGGDAP
jgi:O-antigen ligase